MRGVGAFNFRNGPGVKEDVAKHIPLVPAGDETIDKFPEAKHPWIQYVLIESLNRCSSTGGPALLRANWLVYKLHLKHTWVGRWLSEKNIKPYDVDMSESDEHSPPPEPQAPQCKVHVQLSDEDK